MVTPHTTWLRSMSTRTPSVGPSPKALPQCLSSCKVHLCFHWSGKTANCTFHIDPSVQPREIDSGKRAWELSNILFTWWCKWRYTYEQILLRSHDLALLCIRWRYRGCWDTAHVKTEPLEGTKHWVLIPGRSPHSGTGKICLLGVLQHWQEIKLK